MKTVDEDIVDLLDHAWDRLAVRLTGLTDDEWRWTPSALDPDISIRWRLEHLVGMCCEPRTMTWLGRDASAGVDPTEPSTAASALERVSVAGASVRDAVRSTDLDQQIGRAAGHFGAASRRSFALHLADELIHHGAEVALLRDLYASRPYS